jgi:translation initiation factor IF-2
VPIRKITFLDTPGHEAFTAMRARGAQVTDVAVLVVAADDGVMPQTAEAINHSKAANVPIIVAINKIDKEDANPDRVKQELTEYGLVVEEWGGETIAVPVSAKARTNIETLLEMILLVAEMKELKANPNRNATGTVIEAKLDKGKGPVATVLVSKGTLNVGDIIIAGQSFGRIRAMIDDKGRRVKKAGPSMPVEVQGLSEVPPAGEIFNVVNDEKLARSVTDARVNEKKAEEIKQKSKISLEDLFDKIKEGEVKDLNIIIKADVQGSVEAIKQSLDKLSTQEVRVNIIHGGVGTISESDVMLASASNAIIIGFNVRHDSNTKATAELQGVDIRLYRIIYDAIDDIKAAMEGMLDPDYKEVFNGKAEVRQVFKVPKAGTIAGSYVTEGKINRSSKMRVIRDGIVISENEIESLKRFKDDVKEVTEGYECGIGLMNFNDIKEGDILEAFTMEEVKREL